MSARCGTGPAVEQAVALVERTAKEAGATRLHDGTTLLLCRVEDRRGHSHLSAARSVNGVDGWVIDREPTLRAARIHACFRVLGDTPLGPSAADARTIFRILRSLV